MESIKFVEIGKKIMVSLNCNTYDQLYEKLNFDVLNKLLKHQFKTDFNVSTLTFAKKCYPDWEVCSWKFKSPLKNQWTDYDNRKFAICKYIKEQEKWNCREDFYKLSIKLIEKHCGKGITDYYKGRLYDILMDLLPPKDPKDKEAEDYWVPWKVGLQVEILNGRKGCRSTPKDTFKEKDNRLWYIKWLCKQKNYTIPDDLSKLCQKDFEEFYGRGMIVKYYNTSVFRCLNDLFPEYGESHLKWYMFVEKPKNSFNNLENCIEAMLWLRKKNGWNTPESFYDLSIENFNRDHLGQLIYYKNNSSSFADTIIRLNKDMVFDKSKFLSHKTEKLVYQELKKMGFNIKLHETIYKSSRKTHFKIDLYIQDLNLCIEIDGNQHFRDLLMFYNSQGYEIQLNRDVFKMQKMQEKNISCIRLIQMECWNGKSTWIQNNLIPLIKRYETTQQIYIETTSQYKNIYDEHKMHMNHCLTESDLYLE